MKTIVELKMENQTADLLREFHSIYDTTRELLSKCEVRDLKDIPKLNAEQKETLSFFDCALTAYFAAEGFLEQLRWLKNPA